MHFTLPSTENKAWNCKPHSVEGWTTQLLNMILYLVKVLSALGLQTRKHIHSIYVQKYTYTEK